MSDQFNLPPESVTPGQLFMLLQAMNVRLSQQTAEMVRQGERMEKLERDTKTMREAWQAGGTLLKFIKVLATVAVACGAIWAFLAKFLPGGGFR